MLFNNDLVSHYWVASAWQTVLTYTDILFVSMSYSKTSKMVYFGNVVSINLWIVAESNKIRCTNVKSNIQREYVLEEKEYLSVHLSG